MNRDDWSRSSRFRRSQPVYVPPAVIAPLRPPRDVFFDGYPEFENVRRRAACFVNPNALCPVCQEPVYYYQNEHGSRVFFNEMGKPWEKHGCTDTRMQTSQVTALHTDGRFEVRKSVSIAEIVTWHSLRGFNSEAEFIEKHGEAPWPLAVILKRFKSGKQVFLILKPITEGRAKRVYVSCRSLPKCCKEGFILSIKKNQLSLFDMARLDHKEVTIKRYRGGEAFLNAMTE